MFHEDMCTFSTLNISKLNFLLVICIANNLIFCTLRFQIFKYCPIITNHTSMEILLIYKLDPYDCFSGPVSQMFILYCVLWGAGRYIYIYIYIYIHDILMITLLK